MCIVNTTRTSDVLVVLTMHTPVGMSAEGLGICRVRL